MKSPGAMGLGNRYGEQFAAGDAAAKRFFSHKQRRRQPVSFSMRILNNFIKNCLFPVGIAAGYPSCWPILKAGHACCTSLMSENKSPTQLPDSCDGGKPVTSSLPTLQRNALRKIFERADFTPEEVFALGYRRLQRAEGIGAKGLHCIEAWLAEHGLILNPPEAPADPPSDVPEPVRRSINSAVRLLRHYGYRVERARDKAQSE
jgi:hypothetical protein